MKKLSLLFTVSFVMFLCFTLSCQQQVEEGITEEEVKALVEKSLGIWNEGNLAVVDELYDPGIVRHDSGQPEDIVGLDGFKNYVTRLRTMYPDFKVTFNKQLVSGDMVVLLWTVTGTNTGPMQTPMGELPPTNNKMSVPGIDVVRLVDGKIVEDWAFYNQLDAYMQLGFTITPPAQPEQEEEIK
jgi:steroid delta-isomerase-like uncharacterized protein